MNDFELEQLLRDVLDWYGYDFIQYSRASLRRRITRLYQLDQYKNFGEFRERLRSEPEYLSRFVEEITVNVTEMFRDPSFYRALRREVIPALAAKPFLRIWHAGCSTGEEVYSMAILLKEAGLLQKTLLYATDINPDVLDRARKGIFPLSPMKQYSENYLASGGLGDFSSYYTAKYDRVKFDESLGSRMIFAAHNLVSDRSFNAFHLIVCRNVLIYFDRALQDRVFRLFDTSLETLGFLALGSKETVKFSTVFSHYRQVGKEKIWRKQI